MRLNASAFYALYRPSQCGKRLRFSFAGDPTPPPSPLEKLLFEYGLAHEKNIIASIPNLIDLSQGTEAERATKTRQHLQEKKAPLYQPFLQTEIETPNGIITLVGVPDLLMPTADGWIIREIKLANTLDRRPDISAQLVTYGYLLQQTTGQPPIGTEVWRGDGSILAVKPYSLERFHKHWHILLEQLDNTTPYEPVGWSKCRGCGYFNQCWQTAQNQQDVSLLANIDQNLARALHEQGVQTVSQLKEKFDVKELGKFKRLYGEQQQTVGKKAKLILTQADCFLSQTHEILGHISELPQAENLVMFDLEGIPGYFSGYESVFMWGMKVYGKRPSPFTAATTANIQQDDKATWYSFLNKAQEIFNEYGDLPFIHWGSYEKSKLKLYIDRYGDPHNIAKRVLDNLVDLLRIYRRVVCLPIPSFSLKMVEKFVGFERQLTFNGELAIVTYMQANSAEARKTALSQILQYNEEDLEATWATYVWLKQELSGRSEIT